MHFNDPIIVNPVVKMRLHPSTPLASYKEVTPPPPATPRVLFHSKEFKRFMEGSLFFED